MNRVKSSNMQERQEKIEFFGYLGKEIPIESAFWWHMNDYDELELKIANVYKAKGRKYKWSSLNWPPKRVKVTVEVDDGTD